MLSTIHIGPYDELSTTYQIINSYIQENKIPIIAPTREIFLNSPENTRLESLMTEIQFPIELL